MCVHSTHAPYAPLPVHSGLDSIAFLRFCGQLIVQQPRARWAGACAAEPARIGSLACRRAPCDALQLCRASLAIVSQKGIDITELNIEHKRALHLRSDGMN